MKMRLQRPQEGPPPKPSGREDPPSSLDVWYRGIVINLAKRNPSYTAKRNLSEHYPSTTNLSALALFQTLQATYTQKSIAVH